jgi:hypothetical protein
LVYTNKAQAALNQIFIALLHELFFFYCADPFVKVALIKEGRRLKKRKTDVCRNTLCPVFNEALTFDVKREALRRSSIEFSVMHDSLLGPSELLGRAVVGTGSDRRPQERDFFHEFLTNKSVPPQWLPLSEPE